ncbi:hypothetical protein EIP91_010552 [Steccherinum ochraceum]|uniref:Uncharacterized protein n=1 Tax=Steccherinum ochraceum TaxID=92696 RepID=A0A4R0R0H2_9APHY|nr:hypothetical protein EIP91_010552 [Steccherinum ochraceum]
MATSINFYVSRNVDHSSQPDSQLKAQRLPPARSTSTFAFDEFTVWGYSNRGHQGDVMVQTMWREVGLWLQNTARWTSFSLQLSKGVYKNPSTSLDNLTHQKLSRSPQFASRLSYTAIPLSSSSAPLGSGLTPDKSGSECRPRRPDTDRETTDKTVIKLVLLTGGEASRTGVRSGQGGHWRWFIISKKDVFNYATYD